MTDTPSGAGPCVRGWAKGVPDRDDIRSAHWTVTPIIPIHHQPPPTTPTNYPLSAMSFKHVTDFQEFLTGAGCEGLYLLNKENPSSAQGGNLKVKGQGQVPESRVWLNVPANTGFCSFFKFSCCLPPTWHDVR